jgi:hypothetical protein
MRIQVVVSKRNLFAPTFTQTAYNFYVPVPIDDADGYIRDANVKIGTVVAYDNDTIVYNNNQLHIDFYHNARFDDDVLHRLFRIDDNGGGIYANDAFDQQIAPHRSVNFTIIVCDFGSPKYCSLANVSVVAVAVSSEFTF